MNLLIVNKDNYAANLLKNQLNKFGYNTNIISDISSAANLLQNQKINIIVVDINEKNDQLSINFDDLKKHNKDIIIILTVDFGLVEIAINLCKLHADDYLTKPCSADQLCYTIEKIHKIKELKNENALLKEKIENKTKI